MTTRGERQVPPMIVGEASLRLASVPTRTLAEARDYLGVDPFKDRAVLATSRARPFAAETLHAVPDGNRAATSRHLVETMGRTWALGFKGVGAGAPLYGDGPLTEREGRAEEGWAERPIVRESWMGESPFGGQGEPNARAGIARTDESVEGRLFGMPICPVISVMEIPEVLIEKGHHYRHFSGAVVTEHRLVPSNVRLFHGTGRGLGQAPHDFLVALGLTERPALHAFVERLLGTGLSALTLFASSLRATASGLTGLDFDDAWLDKDSLVGPDGTLFFVDLESLDWVSVPDAQAATQRMRRQLARNAYDLLFAADALLRAHELHSGRVTSSAQRFSQMRELFVLGLDAQPRSERVGLEASARELTVVLRSEFVSEVRLPLLSMSPLGD